jgi:sugar (pentulose or hexulose) kinase
MTRRLDETVDGPFTVGLDVGTTRVKAVTFDGRGTVVALAERPTPWSRDGEAIAMDAAALSGVVRAVVVEASAAVPQVVGVGTTGMGEAGVLTADDGVPLAPVRAWHDPRADVERVRAELGAEAFHRAIGMALDPQPSLPKILQLWVDHPASRAATRFYSVPEWAVACLGGSPGSELSLASRTGLLDVVTGRAWDGAVSLLGRDLLGAPQPAGTPQGYVRAGEGLPASLDGAVLAVGGHDHQTAALAAGAAHDGVLFNSLGTAEALLRFTAGPMTPDVVGALVGDPTDPHAPRITAGLTVVPGHYCVMAGLRTGMALERVAAALGAATRDDRLKLAEQARPVLDDPAALAAAREAVGVEPLEEGLRLTLRAPARPEQVWAAVVDRLVEGTGPSTERIRAAVGDHTAVLASGGWFQNGTVLAAKRRRFPGLTVTAVVEAGAAGAAYLAGVAAGVFPPVPTLDGAPWASAAVDQMRDRPSPELREV